MPSIRISKTNNNGVYFLTFTVRRWYYIFDLHNRWEILADSLNYCIEHKSLHIYAYVLMLNHLHLVVDSTNVSGFVRDFKKFTSKKLKKNITQTEPKVLELFLYDQKYEFWQKTNMPLLIETEKFLLQKKRYIELNPVRKGYVNEPEHWNWSSANPNSEIQVEYWG